MMILLLSVNIVPGHLCIVCDLFVMVLPRLGSFTNYVFLFPELHIGHQLVIYVQGFPTKILHIINIEIYI